MIIIMFFIKSLQNPHSGFSINNYVKFATGSTRLALGNKLIQTRSTDNSSKNFYFNRLPRIWNALPIINYQESPSRTKTKPINYLWHHFSANFSSDNTFGLLFYLPLFKLFQDSSPAQLQLSFVS